MKKHQQPCLAAAGKKEIKKRRSVCRRKIMLKDSALWGFFISPLTSIDAKDAGCIRIATFSPVFVAQLYFLAFLPQPTLLSHVVPLSLSCDLRGYIPRTTGTHWREYNFPRGHLKAIKVKADCIINFGMRGE
jgi:hypothetical protein